jgi:hypothetical protein
MQAYEMDYDAEGIATGHLNDDAYPDLVLAMNVSEQIGLVLSQPGWTFSGLIQTPLSLAADVAVAEIDGISGDELIAVGGDPGQLFLGKLEGPGIFSLGMYPIGMLPRGVAVGDIDGDSTLDVAVANFGSHDVSVLVGESGSLHGEVRLPVDNPNDNPESIAVADLDGDGLAEIIVGMINSNRIVVYGAV